MPLDAQPAPDPAPVARKPRRLLVVSYPWPPLPSVGANRWFSLTKYLRRLGHEVTILTTSLMGGRPEDREQGVVRAVDLAGAELMRRLFRRPSLDAPSGEGLGVDVPPPALLTRVLVPDAYLASWVPFATSAALRLVCERQIDCVITTTPYESTHLVGLVARRRGPAWIADFRDGWTFEPHRGPFPLTLQRRLDERLERLVARRADRVLAATRPIVEDFRRRLGVDAAFVPNAWDPELGVQGGAPSPPILDDRKLSLVHTGTFGVKSVGGRVRDPRPLLEALRRLLSEDASVAERLEIVLVGRGSTYDEDLLGEYGLGGLVRTTGLVPRATALELQRRADALLLITSIGYRSEATGKLFEYLGAGTPILALAKDNEAERVVRETGSGLAIPPDDPAAIAAALRRLAADVPLPYQPRGLDRHTYPAPAEAVAAEVERAIQRRHR